MTAWGDSSSGISRDTTFVPLVFSNREDEAIWQDISGITGSPGIITYLNC